MIFFFRGQFRIDRYLAFTFGLGLLGRFALALATSMFLFLLFGVFLLFLGEIELFFVELKVVGEESGHLDTIGLFLLLLFLKFGDEFLTVSAEFECLFALPLVQTLPPFALAGPNALPQHPHNIVHKNGGLFRRYFLPLVHGLLSA